MATKIGGRIEFGSDIEPCGGVVVSVRGEVVIIRWDSGGEAVTTAGLLAALTCGGKPREAEPTAGVSTQNGLVNEMASEAGKQSS